MTGWGLINKRHWCPHRIKKIHCNWEAIKMSQLAACTKCDKLSPPTDERQMHFSGHKRVRIFLAMICVWFSEILFLHSQKSHSLCQQSWIQCQVPADCRDQLYTVLMFSCGMSLNCAIACKFSFNLLLCTYAHFMFTENESAFTVCQPLISLVHMYVSVYIWDYNLMLMVSQGSFNLSLKDHHQWRSGRSLIILLEPSTPQTLSDLW